MPPGPPSPRTSLSRAEARRIALAAQGFADKRPSAARHDARHLDAVLRRVALLQIDSVNVLARAHYLPLFSRLGPYPPALLDQAAWGGRRRRRLFEYWGHEASLLPLALHPLMRWRMARAARGQGTYTRIARFGRERKRYIDTVLAEIAARGPCGISDLAPGAGGRSAWRGWSDPKQALEYLIWAGRLTTHHRRTAGFERVYDLP